MFLFYRIFLARTGVHFARKCSGKRERPCDQKLPGGFERLADGYFMRLMGDQYDQHRNAWPNFCAEAALHDACSEISRSAMQVAICRRHA